MANTSINGWPVIDSYSSPKLDTKRVPGTTVLLKMHKDVLPLFLALTADYHKEVHKLRPKETGAYNYRHSNLSPKYWSDHSSGTAVDINWNHEGAVGGGPYGGMQRMTPKQIAACAAIKRRYEIVIWGGDKRRGGDYVNPEYWDPMHYALKPGTTLADVKRVIKKLGIQPNGKRAGVVQPKTDALKAIVATENTEGKPQTQTVKKTAKKAVKKTVKAAKKPVKKVAKKVSKKPVKKTVKKAAPKKKK